MRDDKLGAHRRLIPESVRWLVSKGKLHKAEEILRHAAKKNGVALGDNVLHKIELVSLNKEDVEEQLPKEEGSVGLVRGILTSRVLLLRFITCCFCWLASAFVFFGLTLNSVVVAGDKYVNFMMVGLIEVPAYVVIYFTMDRFRRRYYQAACLALCCASLLVFSFAPIGTTTTLQNHLQNKHKMLYAKLQECKNSEMSQTSKNLQVGLTQPKISDFVNKHKKMQPGDPAAQSITKQIAKMLASEMLPYDFVEGKGFRELLGNKYIAPTYQVPSRTTFSEHYIPALYNETKETLKSQLSNDLPRISALSLTSDSWTSRSTDSYVSLTCHYLQPDFTYVSFALNTVVLQESHTSVNISTTIKSLLSEWGICTETCTVPIFSITDNAANFKLAFSSLFHERSRYCFAHTLQIAIEDSKKDCPGVKTLLSKARGIVAHYRRSSSARKRLHKLQAQLNMPQLEVIQNVDTRWSSEFLMLKRLLQIKAALVAEHANSGNTEMLSSSEWKQAESIVEVLQPLAEATEEMSGESYPTTSMIIPILHCLTSNLESHAQQQKDGILFAKALCKNLKSRFPNFKKEQVSCIAMLVDPRFKGVLMSDVEAGSILGTELKILPKEANEKVIVKSSEEKSVLWAALDSLPNQPATNHKEDEIRNYLSEPRLPRSDDPLGWWRNHGSNKYPNLCVVASKYLGIPATQVSSERLFSVAGNVVTSRRECLLPQHVEHLVFLKANLK
ncbi:zinc finger BED domain-containing protein 4-like isoform X2 [Bacillus rossius redtenbacheri]|uniref:zinc finger BED domain-containing protein 4-like isoform X2 n=1 Tax=Bacillus rossius redtenbacheri TaxID=93214 RepID=UPI002FDC7C21